MTATTFHSACGTAQGYSLTMAPQPRDPGNGKTRPLRARPNGPQPRDTGMHRSLHLHCQGTFAMKLDYRSPTPEPIAAELEYGMTRLQFGAPQPRDPGSGRRPKGPQPRDPGF